MSGSNVDEIRLNKTLFLISTSEAVDQGYLEASFEEMTKAVADALAIERVSLWFYSEDRKTIICSKLFEANESKFSHGQELRAKDFPAYFMYLSEERTLLADDARSNPITKDFLQTYLIPLSIYSMLDAPIRVNGKMIGVICSEKVGFKKTWTQNEALFLGNIADVLARAIQAQERRLALERLKENNENLEKLVLERTKELEKQRAAAEYSAKMSALGEMAAGVAHEINNPLSIIAMRIDQIEECLQDRDLDALALLKKTKSIKTTVNRIANIVRGLRFFAREGKMANVQNVSISNLIEDTLSFCRERFAHHGVQLEIIKNKNYEALEVECSAVEVSQVLLNLLNNSYDAIEHLSQRWIHIEVDEKGQFIQISVTDSGPGIPAEIQDKVMQPFFTTKEIGRGTGLGLSISSGIIQAHQGKLSIDKNCANTKIVIKIPKRQRVLGEAA